MKRIIVTGILILVSISALLRGFYFSYDIFGFLAALALLFMLYFYIKLRNDEPVHVDKPMLGAGLLLVVANGISFINAAEPRENLGTLLLYGEMLVLFIVLYDYFYGQKQKLIRCLMIPVVVVGFASAVVGTMALTDRFNVWDVTTIGGRVGSTFQYANTAAIYFVICLVFAITLVNAETSFVLRSLGTGVGSVFLYAFFMTGSRGGYLVFILIIPLLVFIMPTQRWVNSIICLITIVAPVFLTLERFDLAVSQHSNIGTAVSLVAAFAIAAVSYALLHLIYSLITGGREIALPKGARFVFGGFLIVAVTSMIIFSESIVGLLPAVMAKRLDNLITEGFNDINIVVRLQYDVDALKLIAKSWPTGFGGGGWKAMYQSVQDSFYTAPFVHNHYLQVFVENGILGFLSFVAMVLFSIGGCICSYVKYRGVASGSEAVSMVYIGGLLCALISLAGHAAVDYDLSFVSLLLLLWVMFAASMTRVEKVAGVEAEAGTGTAKAEMASNGDNICGVGNKGVGVISKRVGKLVLVVVSLVLFLFYGVYFGL